MLAHAIRESSRRFADTPLLIDASGRPATYAEVDRISDEVAAGMERRGVEEGDVIALTLPSVPEYVVAYTAAAKVGAVTAGVNPRLAAMEQTALVEMVEPRLLLSSPSEVGELRVAGGAPRPLPPDPARPVAIVFTSGTTGLPKGAVFDEARIAAIAEIDLGADVWGGGGPMLASTEFCHIGFTTKLAWYLRTGATQVLMSRWRADDALRLAADHRMTALGGVPPQFALMLRSPELERADLSALETVTLGGGPASPDLRAAVRDHFGARISVRFSSTESGGCGTGTAFDAPDEEALFTEGRPRGPIELSIRDEAGRLVEPGEVGEVCFRSPTAMVGYWRDDEATAAAFHPDGAVRTGDLGRLDEAGCLRLAGRAKEMYVRGGYNVYPAEVEVVLSRHPLVAEVAVVPRPHDVMGEIGVAVVVPAAGPAVSLDDLRAFARVHLASHKLPEALRVVEALPLTPMQKVDRRALAALVDEG